MCGDITNDRVSQSGNLAVYSDMSRHLVVVVTISGQVTSHHIERGSGAYSDNGFDNNTVAGKCVNQGRIQNLVDGA